MDLRAFDFATIGFRPYAETGEFVTIGAVAFDPAKQDLGYALLERKRTGRIRRMFPALNPELYAEARRTLDRELESVSSSIFSAPLASGAVAGPGVFKAIVSPREGIFCFPVKGRTMAPDMATVLQKLRERFIDQKYLKSQSNVEGVMARQLARVLASANLLAVYTRNVKIGPEDYKVTFPFAHMAGESRADRVLRPLNFDQPTTTEIYNHGDEWIQKFKRLDRLGYRPDHCLITYRKPPLQDEQRSHAFEELKEEFTGMNFIFVEEGDNARVLDFSRVGEGANFKLTKG